MGSKQVLQQCLVFQSLSGSELDKVISLSRFKEFEAGATVFDEGGKAEDLYVLESGKIALQMQLAMSQSHLSKRVTVDVITSGELFGWSVVVEPLQYTLTAVCLEPSKVLAIDGVRLRTLLKDDPRIGYEMMSGLIKVVAARLDETRHVLISERLVSLQS